MYLLLFIFWLILNARITPEIVIFDIIIVGATEIFAQKVLNYRLSREWRVYRNIPFFIHYLAVLIREIIKASILVIRDSLTPSRRPDPCVVEFHSGLKSNMANVLLANSITLTPGTYTLFQQGDHFVVHCLMKEYGEGMSDSCFVRLLGKLR